MMENSLAKEAVGYGVPQKFSLNVKEINCAIHHSVIEVWKKFEESDSHSSWGQGKREKKRFISW